MSDWLIILILCLQELWAGKRTGDYEKDWNDTPAGRKLLLLEGSYYVLLIAGLVASVGSIILKGINVYMRKQLSYFTFHYPVGAIAGSIVIMEIMCVIICNLLILKK